jgi:hypothetical protein
MIKILSNIPGWRTKRKIIVFLVDDWGTIRIANKDARKALLKLNILKEFNRFDNYDVLESDEDLFRLFEILNSFKDKNGRSAIFTAVTNVANPDFDKIMNSEYREYYYEPFTATLDRYYGKEPVKLWSEGIKNNIFVPQFHGREHLNVKYWLQGLQTKDPNLIEAFRLSSIGVTKSNTGSIVDYMSAFDFESVKDIDNQMTICKEGLSLFYEIFRFKASLFTSPSLIHNSRLEEQLYEDGIKYVDRAKITYEPKGEGTYNKQYFWLGRKNKTGQTYITRNCMFEPNAYPRKEIINDLLHDISIAFRMKKPAIISSHRVNFVGGLDINNRDIGLLSLRSLLTEIVNKWPDIEFMTGADLGNLITQKDSPNAT